MLPVSFFVRTQEGKFGQQITLLLISATLFGALAMASFNIEIFTCTSTTCTKESFIFTDNAYIFGFFGLIMGVLVLIKSFDAFYFAKGRL